jgi:hypothetical protein
MEGEIVTTQTTTDQEFSVEISEASAVGFAEFHFGGANLGHKARTKALVRAATQISRHPGGTLPTKMANPTSYKSMDALMNRPEVTHASVLACHQERTRAKMEASDKPLLIVHDATNLDYSGLSIAQLGQVGNGGGRGYICHNALVVDPSSREALGLIYQKLHVRRKVPKKESAKAKREHPQRESRLWSDAVTALGTPPPGKRWIDVCDRGADIFEFLATEQSLGRSCVVRASYNRMIVTSHTMPEKVRQPGKRKAVVPQNLLFDYLKTLPAQTHKSKTMFDREDGKDRKVELSIAWSPVMLLAPQVSKGIYSKEPVRVYALRVWEPDPPQGKEPLQWFLLTFEEITNSAKAWEIASFYECRFVVEEYHKAQKTGCQIEDLQFETAQSLQPMIGILSVIAVMLLNLRQAAKREGAETRKATEIIDPEYEEVLRAWRHKQPHGELSIKEFYIALARLGGHMNRKSDGFPGWLTLWRGWMKLELLVVGAAAERRRQNKIAG